MLRNQVNGSPVMPSVRLGSCIGPTYQIRLYRRKRRLQKPQGVLGSSRSPAPEMNVGSFNAENEMWALSPSAWRLTGRPRIEDCDAETAEIFHVPRHDDKTVVQRSRGYYPVRHAQGSSPQLPLAAQDAQRSAILWVTGRILPANNGSRYFPASLPMRSSLALGKKGEALAKFANRDGAQVQGRIFCASTHSPRECRPLV